MSRDKIVSLEKLAEIVAEEKRKGRRVVHCHGVFDLMHIGHIRHFQQAKAMADLLIVTLTPDRFVNKGPGRPAFQEDLRLEMIASLGMVDYVALNRWPTAVETLKLVKPSFYVKGIEYKDAAQDVTGGILEEEEAVRSVGGEMAFTDDIVFSSTALLNKHYGLFPKETVDYLTGFAQRYSREDVIGHLKKAQPLKVLVVGEAIIDEYHYCEAIGKSSKEPVLAMKSLYSEKFAGGSLAVANHVANFCDRVGLVTLLGDTETHEDFIAQKLNPRVERHFLKRKNSPTILKKRLIEQYFFTKLLEVYTFNDAELCDSDNDALCDLLNRVVPQYDVVIVTDFGHSMMSRRAVEAVVDKARFLAVNAQANAGNMGYNVISKYPRADYVTMADKEMRLEARDRRGDLHRMIEDVSRKMRCPRVVVTRGMLGCVCFNPKEGLVAVPAFARTVVDRVGAGDALLSITSLCAAVGAPMEVIGFIGNAVGAWAVSIVCNAQPVERVPLFKQIETLMK